MTDPFKDFDRDFTRSQQTFKIVFGLTVTVIVLIALATIVGLGHDRPSAHDHQPGGCRQRARATSSVSS